MVMFRSMSSEQHFNRTAAPQSPSAGLEGANAAGHGGSDGSWISMLAVVSRPAWSIIQKYLPGKSQPAALTPWDGEAAKSRAVLENSLVAGFDSLLPVRPTPVNVSYLSCQNGGAETLNWLSAESLGELGIDSGVAAELKEPGAGYLAAARNFLSYVMRNARPMDVWHAGSAAPNSRWQDGGIWGGDATRQRCEDRCSHAGRSPVTVAEATGPREGESMQCEESTGPQSDNASLHVARPEFLAGPKLVLQAHQSAVVGRLVSGRAVAVSSEVAVLTPDQDNGYSSLEEENANAKQQSMKLESETTAESPTGSDEGENEGDEERPALSEQCEVTRQEEEEEEDNPKEGLPTESSFPYTPRCQNKQIAYIMGSPCSDESESDEDSDWDSDDDAGFNSECSSHISDSEELDDSDDGEDEEDSDTDESDSESERLWNSLCQNRDPYNPRNFTAPIRTAPKSCPAAADSNPSGSPAEHALSPFSSPSSSPSPLVPKDEESSDEVCSMDEAENARLWNSFSCSSDPYSPLNFQAPIRTREPVRGRCKKAAPVGPPLYKKEEAEERLDSGFSEVAPVQSLKSDRCVRLKKVTFVEEVEEFYASGDEDRRGPWEEFARDRCRFQRRVQEVEETISYCLTPAFRLIAFQRLYHSS